MVLSSQNFVPERHNWTFQLHGLIQLPVDEGGAYNAAQQVVLDLHFRILRLPKFESHSMEQRNDGNCTVFEGVKLLDILAKKQSL